MNTLRRRRVKYLCTGTATIALLATAACGTSADSGDAADAFPSQNIELVIPYPPGGSTDSVARALADSMNGLEGMNGHQVQVSNISGAGGATALSKIESGGADGHVIGMFPNSAFTSTPLLYDVPYETEDFTVLRDVARSGLVIVGQADASSDDLKDLLAEDGATIGNAGSANMSETEAMLLIDGAGSSARVVNFEGAGPAMTAMLGGEVDSVITAMGTVTGQIENDEMKGLVFIGEAPAGSVLEDIPSAEDLGLKTHQPLLENSNIVTLNSELPKDVQDKIASLMDEAGESDGYTKAINDMGMTVPLTGTDDLNTMLDEEVSWYEKSAKHLCANKDFTGSGLCKAWEERPQ